MLRRITDADAKSHPAEKQIQVQSRAPLFKSPPKHAAWVLSDSDNPVKKNYECGNTNYGATTPSISPLRVTFTFGARRTVAITGIMTRMPTSLNATRIFGAI